MKILKQGAEAILYKENNNLVKERIAKNYRIKQIDDKLIKIRTKKEAKLLKSVEFSPKVFDSSKNKIIMEFIDGKLFKDILDKLSTDEKKKICGIIGKQIAELHNKNIIHGDLTTSNIILKEDKVYFVNNPVNHLFPL